MGLALRQAAVNNDYEYLYNVINIITQHNDFKAINPITKEDYIKKGIVSLKDDDLAYILDTTEILVSKDIEKHIKEYIVSAIAANKHNSAEIMDEFKTFYCLLPTEERDTQLPEKRMTTNESQNLREELEIRKQLSQYKLTPNINDPQSLDEVGGMFKAKQEIDEFIIKPWDRRYRQKIIDNKLNRPSGFLLVGEPGCGKTYIMKAIGAQTGYPVYEVNLANIGTSAAYKMQNDIKKMFDNFEKLYKLTDEPNILILDEIDSIAMSREKVKTDWKIDDINAILMALNNSGQRGIIVVGATNNPNNLDKAVKRPGRLDRQIVIEKPDKKEREDIVSKLLTDKPVGKKLINYIEEMACRMDKMTPAQISAIINETCLHAIYSDKEMADMNDFNFAVEKIEKNSEITKRAQIGFNSNNK